MTQFDAERARAGHTGDGVRAMLAWGIAAAFVGLLAALVIYVH